MKTLTLIALELIWAGTLFGEIKKEFPAHWGKPPEIQTQDYVELPAGYGHGSSTVRHWINANLERDKAAPATTEPSAPALYTNDFEHAALGAVPEGMMVLGGEFTVKSAETNRFLELPGAPLDSFAVQFGPGEKADVAASARIFSTAKGRRAPTFGVGLGGVSGWKLQVAPGKKALELLRDQEVKASVPFEWKLGAWTHLHLEIRSEPNERWKITGRAGEQSAPAGSATTISFEETEEPVPGRASVFGSPFAGTPIWFDDLKVLRLGR
jgi:hypothetical protein